MRKLENTKWIPVKIKGDRYTLRHNQLHKYKAGNNLCRNILSSPLLFPPLSSYSLPIFLEERKDFLSVV